MNLQQLLGVVPKTLNEILSLPSKLESLLGVKKDEAPQDLDNPQPSV